MLTAEILEYSEIAKSTCRSNKATNTNQSNRLFTLEMNWRWTEKIFTAVSRLTSGSTWPTVLSIDVPIHSKDVLIPESELSSHSALSLNTVIANSTEQSTCYNLLYQIACLLLDWIYFSVVAKYFSEYNRVFLVEVIYVKGGLLLLLLPWTQGENNNSY